MFSAAELGILVEEKTLLELQGCIHPTRQSLNVKNMSQITRCCQLNKHISD